jgi:hypothetical protein
MVTSDQMVLRKFDSRQEAAAFAEQVGGDVHVSDFVVIVFEKDELSTSQRDIAAGIGTVCISPTRREPFIARLGARPPGVRGDVQSAR